MKWTLPILLCIFWSFVNASKRFLEEPILEIETPLEVKCREPICFGPLSGIYCGGPILTTSWQFGLQKTCPGDKLKMSADEVYENFHRLLYPIRKADFETFCEENFEQINYLQIAELKDWMPNPKFLEKFDDLKEKKLGQEIHDRWNRLAREFTSDVNDNPGRYPLIPVDHPFIVPGGRFDVYFYWDTYWIIKGLLVSEMFETAKGIIQNFSDLVNQFGYISNSGNLQLTRRSQPPLFGHMVWEYTRATKKYKQSWLQSVEREMEFWERNRTTSINGHSMFVYKTATSCPRPENFLSDFKLGNSTSNPENVWKSISSACESGWDFSSRWTHQNYSADMSTLHTDQIIPVDLNVIIAKNYEYMAIYANHYGKTDDVGRFRWKCERLTRAIEANLWDEQRGAWFDYDMTTKKKNFNFYPSNVYPLMLTGFEKYSKQVEKYIYSTGVLDFRGGIPSGLPTESTQQWDFPNVWAPNQHFIIKSFMASNSSFLHQKAKEQAANFIETVYNGLYNPPSGKVGGIWEKYDARSSEGMPGAGGEYSVQEGFGWTNGAVLDLMWMFRAHKRMDKAADLELTSGQYSALVYAAAGFCALVAILVLVKGLVFRKNTQYEHVGDEAAENLLANNNNDEDML